MHCSSDISAAASRERRYHGQQRTSELENDFPGSPDGGSPAWIRTTIHGSKGRCPTIRRPGNSEEGALRFSVAFQRKDYPSEVCPRTPISIASSPNDAYSNHPMNSDPKLTSSPRPSTSAFIKKLPNIPRISGRKSRANCTGSNVGSACSNGTFPLPNGSSAAN